MPSLAKQLRYRLEWLAITLMARIIPLLPHAVMLRMAGWLGHLAYLLDRRGRQNALENVRCVIAAGILPCLSPDELVKKSYQLFARSMCELFWSARLNEENYSQFIQVEIEDQEAFNQAAKEGAIWVTPHYGNFEWISLMMGYRGHPFTLVAQDFKNPLLTKVFSKQRQLSGHKVISSHRAMLRLLKVLRSGNNAAFLTDLNVPPDNAASPIRCFSFLTRPSCLPAPAYRGKSDAGNCNPLLGWNLPNENVHPLCDTLSLHHHRDYAKVLGHFRTVYQGFS